MGAPAVSNVFDKARKLLFRRSVAIAAALLISLLTVTLMALPRFTAQPVPEITYSEFSRELAEKKIGRVLVQDGGFAVSISDRTVFVRLPNSLISADMINRVTAAGAEVDFKKPGIDASHVASILVPLVMVAAVLLLL